MVSPRLHLSSLDILLSDYLNTAIPMGYTHTHACFLIASYGQLSSATPYIVSISSEQYLHRANGDTRWKMCGCACGER